MNTTLASSSSSRSAPAEWELGVHQRGMIDACFEEGQYASAIAVMDQLRLPKYKPYPQHIQLLLYLALNSSKSSLEIECPPVKIDNQILSSQRAIKKAPGYVAPEVVDAAHTLLTSYALTNSPEASARALPSFTNHAQNTPMNLEQSESIIAQRAQCIKRARNCWEILRADFLLPLAAIDTATTQGKMHLTAIRDEAIDEDQELALVGEHAWRILEWLLVLFERDEELAIARGLPRHAPLLIHQLPPSRSQDGTRWEVDQVLSLVLFALRQASTTRRHMGERLLTLFVNLSATPEIDRSLFIAATQRRLSLVSSQQFERFLSAGPATPVMLKFRISLCQKIITTSVTHLSSSPQPKVARKPRKLIGSSSTPTPSALGLEHHKEHLPNANEVLVLLQQTPTDLSLVTPDPKLERTKFTLLSSYGLLRFIATDGRKEDQWSEGLHTGKVRNCVQLVFSGNPERFETLNALLEIWEYSQSRL